MNIKTLMLIETCLDSHLPKFLAAHYTVFLYACLSVFTLLRSEGTLLN